MLVDLEKPAGTEEVQAYVHEAIFVDVRFLHRSLSTTKTATTMTTMTKTITMMSGGRHLPLKLSFSTLNDILGDEMDGIEMIDPISEAGGVNDAHAKDGVGIGVVPFECAGGVDHFGGSSA